VIVITVLSCPAHEKPTPHCAYQTLNAVAKTYTTGRVAMIFRALTPGHAHDSPRSGDYGAAVGP
jgi:hypothetical protein